MAKYARLLVAGLIFASFGLGLIGFAKAQGTPDIGGTAGDYERRSELKLEQMGAALTDGQATRIRYLLGEQHSMVELFTRHGLLGEAELAEKVGTIREVTRFRINDGFTPEQLAVWWTLDLRLDEAELAKPARRVRVVPER